MGSWLDEIVDHVLDGFANLELSSPLGMLNDEYRDIGRIPQRLSDS